MREVAALAKAWWCGYLLFAQIHSKVDGAVEAAWVGFALPGDVQCSAVVDAGSDDGEAECGVDRAIERECFDRDMALIVIHADEDIGCFSFPGEECRVRGERTFHVDPFFAC